MDVKRSVSRYILIQFQNKKKQMILEGLGHAKRMRKNITKIRRQWNMTFLLLRPNHF